MTAATAAMLPAPTPAAEAKLARALSEAARKELALKLAKEFGQAAREETGEGQTGGASDAPHPAADAKPERQQRTIELPREFNEAAANPYDTGGDDGPRPEPPDDGPDDHDPDDRGPSPGRPRRTRKRDLDRGR